MNRDVVSGLFHDFAFGCGNGTFARIEFALGQDPRLVPTQPHDGDARSAAFPQQDPTGRQNRRGCLRRISHAKDMQDERVEGKQKYTRARILDALATSRRSPVRGDRKILMTWFHSSLSRPSPGCHQIVMKRADTCPGIRSEQAMDYYRRFNFLFAAPAFDADDLEGMRFNQIVERSSVPASRSSRHAASR